MAFGSSSNWMNAFPLPSTRPSRPFLLNMCSRLKVLMTLITPSNLLLVPLNLISCLPFHLSSIQFVLMGPQLTPPPTAQPRHRTCLSGAPWPVGKPTGPTSRRQFATKWMNVYENRLVKPMKLLVSLAVCMKLHWPCRRILSSPQMNLNRLR